MKTFALSRIWYRAQVLPLPASWASKFEAAIARFLWRGFQFRNLLSMETVCQPVEAGGLGIPYLRAKCDALLLKQMLRMIISAKNCYNHICFWLSSVLEVPEINTFRHFKIDLRGRQRPFLCDLFKYMSNLYSEAVMCE